MKTTRTPAPAVSMLPLESRVLLSHGFGHHHHGLLGEVLSGDGIGRFRHGIHVPAGASQTVLDDVAAVKADQAKLETDRSDLSDTLHTDAKAVRAAVKTADAGLTGLHTTLTNDIKTWSDTLIADRAAFKADAGDDAAQANDRAKFKTDRSDARTAIGADIKAINDAIEADPAVVAARAKLATDSQPITDDLAKLKTDVATLKTDIEADNSALT